MAVSVGVESGSITVGSGVKVSAVESGVGVSVGTRVAVKSSRGVAESAGVASSESFVGSVGAAVSIMLVDDTGGKVFEGGAMNRAVSARAPGDAKINVTARIAVTLASAMTLQKIVARTR